MPKHREKLPWLYATKSVIILIKAKIDKLSYTYAIDTKIKMIIVKVSHIHNANPKKLFSEKCPI